MVLSRVLVLYDAVRSFLVCFKNRELVVLRLLIQYQHAEELASIYICFSTGVWFNTPLSSFVHSTCGHV